MQALLDAEDVHARLLHHLIRLGLGLGLGLLRVRVLHHLGERPDLALVRERLAVDTDHAVAHLHLAGERGGEVWPEMGDDVGIVHPQAHAAQAPL